MKNIVEQVIDLYIPSIITFAFIYNSNVSTGYASDIFRKWEAPRFFGKSSLSLSVRVFHNVIVLVAVSIGYADA